MAPERPTRSLDDVLRAKQQEAAVSDARAKEEALKKTREEAKARLPKLKEERQELELIERSIFGSKDFEGEVPAREAAVSTKHQADESINRRAGELEEHGITKEDLFENPDYADVAEVASLRAATEKAALYQVPSVGSEELRTKLASLGVELPAEATEAHVKEAISGRLAQLQEEQQKLLATLLEGQRSPAEWVDSYLRQFKQQHPRAEPTYKDIAETLRHYGANNELFKEHPELRSTVAQSMGVGHEGFAEYYDAYASLMEKCSAAGIPGRPEEAGRRAEAYAKAWGEFQHAGDTILDISEGGFGDSDYRVFNVAELAQIDNGKVEQEARASRVNELKQELEQLGERPRGWGARKAKEAWDGEHTRLTEELAAAHQARLEHKTDAVWDAKPLAFKINETAGRFLAQKLGGKHKTGQELALMLQKERALLVDIAEATRQLQLRFHDATWKSTEQ